MVSETEHFDFIFDAWALLAHFDNEVGAGRVREILKLAENEGCTIGMSIINLGEVAYITERERGLAKTHEVLATIRSLPITILPADEKVVLSAANIKAHHRLSYADAFAAATAKLWRGKLLTGGPELTALEGGDVTIERLSR